MKSCQKPIAILGRGAIGPWGNAGKVEDLRSNKHFITPKTFKGVERPIAPISGEGEKAIADLQKSSKPYAKVDRSVLLAILAAREAALTISFESGWKTGVNIGSSRGATCLFEHHYKTYLESGVEGLSPFASPTTTLGNLSSWVMEDLELSGSFLSHSNTCSTALQALANGMAWLKAGMTDLFIAGGAEAPLTPFTLAQMQALKIYAEDAQKDYPAKPLAKTKDNRMVLGEGAAAFVLRACEWEEIFATQPLGILESMGFGSEQLEGFTGLSKDGFCFQKAMDMALKEQATGFDVDLILMHAPGTKAGDQSELNAIHHVFGDQFPMIYSNKWQIGHTFGASGALSLIQALSILQSQQLPQFPYKVISTIKEKRPIRKIMVNAAGFGGNASAAIVSLPF